MQKYKKNIRPKLLLSKVVYRFPHFFKIENLIPKKDIHKLLNSKDSLGVSASPPVSGSKSAAGSRVAAKPQKELPPVAFLRQRHIGFRPCGLSAYVLTLGNGKNVASS